MQKIKIVRRGFNSRRYFRKLNSVTELVGKEVEVADNQDTVQAEIEEVSVTNDEVTLTLDNGDDVVLDSNEVENLLETGEAISEDDSTEEPEFDEYSVTREVLDADGNVNEVTTVVESEDEDSAIETVTLLDSRRGRNSRNYVVRKSNSRRRNSSSVKYRDLISAINSSNKVNLYEFLRDSDKDTELFVLWAGAGGSGMEDHKIKVSDILNGWRVARVYKTKYGYVAQSLPDSGSNYDEWNEAKSKLGIPSIYPKDFTGGSWESNSRRRNSSSIPTFTIVIEGDGEYEITDAYVDGSYVGADSFGDITVDPKLAKQIKLGNVAELHWNSLEDYENGVTPNVTYLNCDTKRNSIYRVSRKVNGCVRKASVMACNSEDAVDAVKESDGDATVESEYSVEEGESTESPVIISDEEVVENPTEGDGTEGGSESDEKLEEPASQSESTEVKVDETPGESTEVTVSDEPAEASIEEADRESNSFKGVAEFVNRKYGVKL